MGRKKLSRLLIEGLFSTISSMLVPAHVLEHFDILDAHEYSDRWVIDYSNEYDVSLKGVRMVPELGFF